MHVTQLVMPCFVNWTFLKFDSKACFLNPVVNTILKSEYSQQVLATEAFDIYPSIYNIYIYKKQLKPCFLYKCYPDSVILMSGSDAVIVSRTILYLVVTILCHIAI